MNSNSRLIEFVVHGEIDDVNSELTKRGLSSVDVLTIQYEPKPNLPIGENRASYRVISRAA